MRPTHIYWFCYFDMHEPSVRYRAKYPLQMLHDEYGIRSTLVMPGYTLVSVTLFLLAFFRALLFRKRGSVIVFQKLHTGRLYIRALKCMLRVRPRATIYDTDDADYLRFPVTTIHHFAALCTACTVGSEALREYFTRLNPCTAVLTSPVIQHLFQKTKRSSVFTVGWIGYWCDHRDSLMQLAFPGLRALPFPLKLVLIGMPDAAAVAEVEAFFTDTPHITLECPLDVDWLDEGSIYRRVASFDAGLAPLLDTEMNRAKSAFKAKQYLSCGVPVLGSGVGENATFIEDGVNGYICDIPRHYTEHLSALATMSDVQYSNISKAAHASLDRFSTRHFCDELMRISAGVLGN